ncbi:MAG: chemotaxis protein CheX [Desulfotignum sp.]|nr:chemotaxis protein CheX [Desulfobacteraceae bacterium]
MNVAYINPFVNACIDVFDTFAGIASTPGKPVALKQPGGHGAIKVIIGLNGHGINGYFIISFSRPFLDKIITGLFDMTSSASTAELDDLAGELTNMITGSAKAQLSKQGYFFDVAVPRISHTLPDIPVYMKDTPVIMVPFATSSGEYTIEASMKTIAENLAADHQQMFTIAEFSKRCRLSPARVKSFLRTGFLKGIQDPDKQWLIHRDQIDKFK